MLVNIYPQHKDITIIIIIMIIIISRVPFRMRSKPFEISWAIFYAFCFYIERHAYAYFNNTHA